MDIKNFVKEVHENAKAHGWWEDERSFGELIALCHSELSEALEEFRKGFKFNQVYTKGYVAEVMSIEEYANTYSEKAKPEGIPFELADVIIRIFDMCGRYGIDIEKAIEIKHEFNKTRPYKHGNKVI